MKDKKVTNSVGSAAINTGPMLGKLGEFAWR
jgi:hypothetical protein